MTTLREACRSGMALKFAVAPDILRKVCAIQKVSAPPSPCDHPKYGARRAGYLRGDEDIIHG